MTIFIRFKMPVMIMKIQAITVTKVDLELASEWFSKIL